MQVAREERGWKEGWMRYGEKGKERGQTMKSVWENVVGESDRETEGWENEIYCAVPFQSVEKSKAILRQWALSCFIRLFRCIPLWANLPRVRSKRLLMHTVKSFKNTSVDFSANTLFLQGKHVWMVCAHSSCDSPSLFRVWVSNMQCPFSSQWETLSKSSSGLVPSYEYEHIY